jgi:hypothetical protein
MVTRATSFFIPILLIVITTLIVLFARGWRFNVSDRELLPTGILVATSEPDGAQVYVNGKFTAATNSNIDLSPDWYDISITKEGYHEWKRRIRLQGEVVVKTDTVLFLRNPSLTPLTATGVSQPLLSPDNTKIAYIASPSAIPNIGKSVFEEALTAPTLFVYDLSFRGLPFSKNPQPYSGTVEDLLAEWEREGDIAQQISIRKLPKEFTAVATDSLHILSFAPDETKVLYEATRSANLERAIIPPLIGLREIVEDRELQIGNVYVYDVTEDRNYNLTGTVGKLIVHPATPTPTPRGRRPTVTPTATLSHTPLSVFWLGTSRHLVLVEKGTIGVMEYDGSNKLTLYAGPFDNGYVFPHPSGRQVIIMTTFNPAFSPIPILYTLNIR